MRQSVWRARVAGSGFGSGPGQVFGDMLMLCVAMLVVATHSWVRRRAGGLLPTPARP